MICVVLVLLKMILGKSLMILEISAIVGTGAKRKMNGEMMALMFSFLASWFVVSKAITDAFKYL